MDCKMWHIFTVTALLTMILIKQGFCQEEPGYCKAFVAINEVTKEDKQVETVTSILDSISPEISEALKLSVFTSAMNTSSESTAQVAYESLAESFGVKPTPTGYTNFIEAVNEVSLAQAEACSNSSFLPTPDLVSQLAEDFETMFTADDQDLTELRSVYGKLLCLNSRSESSRKKRQANCECKINVTIDRLSKAKTICELFKCLTEKFEIQQFAQIFGLEVSGSSGNEDNNHIPCLAFALDYSGSMAEELDAAKQIIRGFLVNDAAFNERLCYILVIFSRFPEPRPDVEKPQIVYILKEDEVSRQELMNFIQFITDLKLEGGGGGPEHALDGMLAALRATNADGRDLMIPGSQLIVLTDEPTENKHLSTTVIEEAQNRSVCIHFFIRDGALQEESFHEIAEQTFGTTIQEFSALSLSNFVTKYRESPCESAGRSKRSIRFGGAVKRQTRLNTQCKIVHVSGFTYLLTLSIQASPGSTVSVTRPNGTITQLAIAHNLGTLVEANPEEGQWRVCVNFGDLVIIPDQKIVFDTSILFVNEGSENPSSIPPPLCTSSRIALLSSQSSKILFASLNLINVDGTLARRINLKKCSGFLVSDVITFARGASGTYQVQLTGHDSNGVAFMQDTGHRVVLDESRSVNYELVAMNGSIVDNITVDDTLSFSFELYNPGTYSTNFHFASSSVRGFKKNFMPIVALVPPRESVEITFTLEVDPQNVDMLSPDSPYRFTLFGSNGCRSVSASKTVLYL